MCYLTLDASRTANATAKQILKQRDDVVADVVTDPKLKWDLGRVVNGTQRYEVTGIRDGVKIFAVTDGNDIITAYPIGR